jgi:rhamnosyltransferase
MKLAVLMSTYNGEQYIKQQLQSIWDQTCDCDVAVYVRDDGSSDSTQAILQEYADQGLLHWYTGENLRPAKSFLHLLQNCPDHDFYAFADQDDVWAPEKLQSGINLIKEAKGPAFSFANARLVDRDLNDLGRSVYRTAPHTGLPTISCAGGILGCTMVFNHALAQLIKNAPMPQALIMHDFYLAIVCALAGGQIFYDHTPRMGYRQHGGNVIGVSRSKFAAVKNRLKTVTKKAPVSVGSQATSVLELYPHLGTAADRQWMKRLSNRCFFSRLAVACSRKPRFISKNQSLTLRLAILLGNR